MRICSKAHGRLVPEKINIRRGVAVAVTDASGQKTEPKTGLFYRKSSNDYVVLWQGREICRYTSMEAFVAAHADGIDSLEANQAELLASFYKSP